MIPEELVADGYRLMDRAAHHEALAAFTHATSIDPGHVQAWNGRALVEIALGEKWSAARSLERSIELDPNQVATLVCLATTYLDLDQLTLAKRSARDAVARGESVEAAHVLGIISLREQQYSEALQWLATASRAAPENAEIKANMAAAAFGAGDLQLSARLFSELSGERADLVATDKLGAIALLLARLATEEPFAVLTSHFATVALAEPAQRELLKSLVVLLQRFNLTAIASAVATEWGLRYPADEEARYIAAALKGGQLMRSPEAYVAAHFDAYAERFDAHLLRDLQYSLPDLISQRLTGLGLPEIGLSVLDAGCGTGLCAPYLRRSAHWLEGIDLSPRMLMKAKARNLYDLLQQGDLVERLGRTPKVWDLVVAADVFIYLGDLTHIAATARIGLKAGGVLIFSIEQCAACETYCLQPNGRFAHSLRYIDSVFEAGFQGILREEIVLRKEGGAPVRGHLIALRRE